MELKSQNGLSNIDPLCIKLEKTVLDNLANDQLTVDEISSEIGLSRSQLHRKIKMLTGKSTSQFIREIRLIEASKLIEFENLSTKEIAYKVGFSSSTYFNKCFHEYFGCTPSEFNSRLIKGTDAKVTYRRQRFYGVRNVAFVVSGVLIILFLSYFLYSNFTAKQLIAEALPEVTDKSIAVLPFKNVSPDADNQYFADGMMDEILNHLQKISELGVKSRTAVEPYRNSTQSFATIAQELNVSFVLEGVVRKHGDRFRVSTQLIDVESGNNLWSETYDGIFSDTIFVIQSNIAKQIASALDVVITPEQENVIDKFPTTNVAAYELVILGTHEMGSYWRKGDTKVIPTARKFFDRALLIDPEYYEANKNKGATFMAERNYDSAFVYVEKLLVLDPKSSEAFQLKGECYYFMGKTDLAIDSYTNAINMSSFKSMHSKVWTYLQIARALARKGEVIKALSYFSKALQLDYEIKNLGFFLIAGTFTSIGDYDRAAKYLQPSMESKHNCLSIILYARGLLYQAKFQQLAEFINSNCDFQACEWSCNQVMFRTSLMQGKFEEAAQYFSQWQRSITGMQSFNFSGYDYEIGYVYSQLGKTTEADKVFAEEIQKLKSRPDNRDTYFHLSRISAFKGNGKEALKYLGEYAKPGFRWGLGWHEFVLIDPFFKSLWDDTEFKAIVKRGHEERAVLRAQVRDMEERGELDFPL